MTISTPHLSLQLAGSPSTQQEDSPTPNLGSLAWNIVQRQANQKAQKCLICESSQQDLICSQCLIEVLSFFIP